MEEQWNKFLKQIQTEITNQSFQTWFANIRLLNVGENEITIEVPNRFHYEWLDSKYDQLIQDSVKTAFDKTLSINYTVGMKQETKAAISTAYSPDELIPKKNYHQVSKLNNRYVFKILYYHIK